jgi:16S rRNA (adenine1518-N6/adenine1519-N6)-dimethyltransferase
MINKNAINIIINAAEIKQQDIILEIGPGKGALTKKILETNCKLIAIEIDNNLFTKLKNKHKEKNFQIINDNALKIMHKLNFNKIISNIPYNISEPLIKKILITQPKIVVLTIGINFTEFLENNKLLNILYEYELIKILPKSSFKPKPKTKSAIIKLKLKNNKNAIFFKTLYKQHDKKLKNALIKNFEKKLTKNQVRQKIKNITSKEKSILNCSNTEIEQIKKLIKKT